LTGHETPSDDSSIPTDLLEFKDLAKQLNIDLLNNEHLRDELEDHNKINQINSPEVPTDAPNLASTVLTAASELPNMAHLEALILNSIKNSENEETAIQDLMVNLVKEFGKANVGYSVFHVVYRMAKRIFSFYNSKISSLLVSEAGEKFLTNTIKNFPSKITLTEFIQRFLKLINYQMLIPAAPTYDEISESPESCILLPTPTLFAPLACNVIFKDETTDAQFSRSFLKEPTRLVNNLYPELDNLSKITNN
jgi:hypothetical protein